VIKGTNITGIKGVTRRYKGNGRRLGYPTANINSKTSLEDGIYFGFASLGEYVNKPSLIFVGTPTTMKDYTRRVEAHLLDIPDEDYYGENLELSIIYFYRANKTFKSINELKKAMKTDEAAGRKWFKEN